MRMFCLRTEARAMEMCKSQDSNHTYTIYILPCFNYIIKQTKSTLCFSPGLLLLYLGRITHMHSLVSHVAHFWSLTDLGLLTNHTTQALSKVMLGCWLAVHAQFSQNHTSAILNHSGHFMPHLCLSLICSSCRLLKRDRPSQIPQHNFNIAMS